MNTELERRINLLEAIIAAIHARLVCGPQVTESTIVAIIAQCEEGIPKLRDIRNDFNRGQTNSGIAE